MRGQVPYGGPTGGALAIFYGCIVVWVIVASVVIRRATRGVTGPSFKRRRRYHAGYGSVLIADYALQGALYHAGASHSIVYGIYPTTAPFFFAGAVVVTMGVLREESRSMVLGMGLFAVGIGGAFAGPVAAWLVCGIALAAGLAGFAGIRLTQQHR